LIKKKLFHICAFFKFFYNPFIFLQEKKRVVLSFSPAILLRLFSSVRAFPSKRKEKTLLPDFATEAGVLSGLGFPIPKGYPAVLALCLQVLHPSGLQAPEHRLFRFPPAAAFRA
jgi:hypothetical protein